jgi:hypothetical protein
VKKVRVRNDNCVEKLKKQPNFYARKGGIKSMFYTNKSIILLVYKEVYFNFNKLDHVVPRMTVSLLQEFDDILPNDVPSELPHLKEIKHQINLVPGVMISN